MGSPPGLGITLGWGTVCAHPISGGVPPVRHWAAPSAIHRDAAHTPPVSPPTHKHTPCKGVGGSRRSPNWGSRPSGSNSKWMHVGGEGGSLAPGLIWSWMHQEPPRCCSLGRRRA